MSCRQLANSLYPCHVHHQFLLIVDCREIHPFNNICVETGDGQDCSEGNDSSGPTNNKKASCGTAVEASRVGTFETSEFFFIKNVQGMSIKYPLYETPVRISSPDNLFE